ncbi:MAG: sulfatase-like hydrolase/transferase, partial [bacterium]|nr:sulfatase-like hydrolase/transferase [bacterium]
MKRIVLGIILTAVTAAGAELPNILWVSIEDTGPEIGAYGDTHARTPNIDKLADQGVVFLNAFAHAPVCAVARSGIITGIYPTSIGTHNMRSRMAPPPHVKAFPEYLRAKGYYTTNNSKTDYNFFPPVTAWDESGNTAHWKNRPDKDQPFFAVFNLGSSHEGRIRRQAAARAEDPSVGIHVASELVLPPYYPDTPKVREAWASY